MWLIEWLFGLLFSRGASEDLEPREDEDEDFDEQDEEDEEDEEAPAF